VADVILMPPASITNLQIEELQEKNKFIIIYFKKLEKVWKNCDWK